MVERKTDTQHQQCLTSLGFGARNPNPILPGIRSLRLGIRSRLWMLSIVVWTFALACSPARAEIDALTVQRSIDRGIEYLRKTQKPQGGWNEYGGQSCGLSALCTLAWVNAGVSRQDPNLIQALDYLRGFEPKQTYSVALQTLVFCQVGQPEDFPRIRRNVAWLSTQQKAAGERFAGAWTYGNGRGNGDPSNAQFAVLALGAAADLGIEVDPAIFQLASDYWKGIQLRRGGWSYGGPTPSGSMTCAGIASTLICNGSLRDRNNQDQQLNCCGNSDSDDTVQRGLDFLSTVFTVRANPGGELLSYFYYLYAVERVGRLSGRRLIGDRDWYREGAERLVSLQDDFQGFWQGGGPVETNRDIATSFALLFLAKGKRQVVIGRLDHPSTRDATVAARGQVRAQQVGESAGSQPHAGSLQTLVHHVEKDWLRELTWQNISAEQATTNDLLQTPVLVIASRNRLDFDAALIKRLGDYLDQGGTILFDALAGDGCGDDRAFRQSVTQLCQQWYPQSRLEPLPATHPVWFAEKYVDPKVVLSENGQEFSIEGVQSCCRTPIFYSPQSLMCRWSYGGPLLRNLDLPDAIAGQVKAGITVGENILAYATGRELKDKLDASRGINAAVAPVPTRGAIPIAMASLGAGERQVSRALLNAAAIIREKLAIEVISIDEPIALTDESLSRVGVLYLTGQTAFTLDATARRALQNFIDREGMIFASPICGDEAFAASIQKELQSLTGGDSWEPLPSDHSAFSPQFGGYDITRVKIRTPQQKRQLGGPAATAQAQTPIAIQQRADSPVIQVIQSDRSSNVFYSPLDLSCALESQNSIQCPGYPTDDAAKILAGMILYYLNQ
ncbi:DUF4159 domain-containing protein [Neorhodopirellula lusitana]|uniref:DUF4159 domain-containing protein n=1 Tax=Neorhodopirellula lusitana TaxID=445327 RepID=UPI00384AF1C5